MYLVVGVEVLECVGLWEEGWGVFCNGLNAL